MRLSLNINKEQESAIQADPFPESAHCEHCRCHLHGANCEHEIVGIGLPDETYPIGLAHWLCCHSCRDRNDGDDCETFLSIRLASNETSDH